MTEGFKITQGKGFHIEFKNGWVVSVQFGFGNYCENRMEQDNKEDNKGMSCSNAEVWAWKEKQNYPKDPKGWLSPEEVLKFINKISKKK